MDEACVVGVHGIAQESSTPERQQRLWSDALRLGVAAAHRPSAAVPSLAIPFYGFLFRQGSAFLGPEDDPVDESESAFVADCLAEDIAALPEPELSADTLGPPGVIPPSWLRGVTALDARWGGGKGVLRVGVLRQVYAYLYRRGAGEVIRQIVTDQLTGTTRVLVGHSLGSVICYDVLRRGLAPDVTTLVTLGSPLASATVRRALAVAEDSGAGDPTWTNVFDPWDVVTGGQGLGAPAVDYRVDNGRGDPHALVRYLRHEETVSAILDGAGVP